MGEKEEKKKSKKYLIWIIVLLAVSVIATGILASMSMNKYHPDASGAIEIGPGSSNAQQGQSSNNENAADEQKGLQDSDAGQSGNAPESGSDSSGSNGGSESSTQVEKPVNYGTGTNSGTGPGQGTGQQIGATQTETKHITIIGKESTNPGFEASDEGAVWTTNTSVNIFQASYENSQQQSTVESGGSDNVIAPGTSNSYVFKLKNTGDVPLDFELDIDAYVTPENYQIPVRARLSRYDNKWLVGDQNTWEDALELDNALDSGKLGKGKYIYYTLDWEWPFEEDDVRDTDLGNMAMAEDIALTIVINTSATGDSSKEVEEVIAIPGTGSIIGITIPQTGDNSSIVLWGTVAMCSLLAIIVLLIMKRREEEEDRQREK